MERPARDNGRERERKRERKGRIFSREVTIRDGGAVLSLRECCHFPLSRRGHLKSRRYRKKLALLPATSFLCLVFRLLFLRGFDSIDSPRAASPAVSVNYNVSTMALRFNYNPREIAYACFHRESDTGSCMWPCAPGTFGISFMQWDRDRDRNHLGQVF